MDPNFDLRVSIDLNPENIFMDLFIDFGLAYSPLNSAKLSCSSEVTLACTQQILCEDCGTLFLAQWVKSLSGVIF